MLTARAAGGCDFPVLQKSDMFRALCASNSDLVLKVGALSKDEFLGPFKRMVFSADE